MCWRDIGSDGRDGKSVESDGESEGAGFIVGDNVGGKPICPNTRGPTKNGIGRDGRAGLDYRKDPHRIQRRHLRNGMTILNDGFQRGVLRSVRIPIYFDVTNNIILTLNMSWK